jgi:cytochrome c551/c552
MRTVQITLLAAALVVFACKSKKTNTTTTATTNTNTNNTATGPGFLAKSNDGLFEPGQDELTAAQGQFKDVNMDDLKKGYQIYNKGACTGCHNPKNIYKRPVERWKEIVDDMAVRAAITDADKSAVYKYVISVKSTQK